VIWVSAHSQRPSRRTKMSVVPLVGVGLLALVVRSAGHPRGNDRGIAVDPDPADVGWVHGRVGQFAGTDDGEKALRRCQARVGDDDPVIVMKPAIRAGHRTRSPAPSLPRSL